MEPLFPELAAPFPTTAGTLPSSILQTDQRHQMLQRGPMYSAYAALREARLRERQEEMEPEPVVVIPTPKKKSTPMVARSVPDFSSVLRKENRRPAASRMDTSVASPLPPKGPKAAVLKTPSPPVGRKSVARRSGSVSASGGEEKRCGEFMARRSYSCLKELKGFSDVGNGKTVGGVRRYA